MPIVADFEAELTRRSPPHYGRWHAVDLHNHSPASHDYQGDKANAVELSAKQIVSSGVAVVMFTDHEELPQVAFTEELGKRTKRLIVRGVELNVFVDAWDKPEGKVDKNLFFHLLVGFDPDGAQPADYWLAHLYRTCNEQTREIGTRQIKGVAASIDSVCKILREAGAIVIPSHLHSTKDAFKSRSIDDIYSDPQFLKCARDLFTALEVSNLGTAAFFDGKHAETGYLWKSCVRSSDAHVPELLGTRVTYVQMEEPSFHELRAGLAIPSRTSIVSPPCPESYVLGVNIRGQFFPDLWLSISPHCNALIGVKGSGKTSVLESLRFALGSPVPASRQESVKGHLQGILGAAGSVRVLIQRADGGRLLVERAVNAEGFRATFEDDRQEHFTNPDGLGFPAYILGWHEIEQAATDANIRQVYLDTIAGRERVRQLQEDAQTSSKRIHHLHGQASNEYSAYTTLHGQITRLQELRKGLQELTDDNLIDLRNRYEVALRHKDAISDMRRAIQTTLNEMEARIAEFDLKAETAAFDGESPIRDLLLPALEGVSSIQTEVTTFKEAHRNSLTDLLAKLEALQPDIDTAFEKFAAEYEAAVATLGDAKKRLLESHRRVMEDTRALPRLMLEAETQRKKIDLLLTELSSLSTHIASTLDKKTALRTEKCNELNQQLEPFGVRLSVAPLAERARLQDLSNRYAAGAKIYTELTGFAPKETRHHRRLAHAYESLQADLMGGFHLFFDSAEFGYFVDYFEEDDLNIAFRIGKPGEEFTPIDQLSAGQRCTAVFPLLLKLRAGPLIVDQPEDNLDNRHIADTIAPTLSIDKATRQIAFTSHNANLVVLTDAEHIAMFEATGSQGRAETRGFLCSSQSKIAKDVIATLDGGEKALQLRYRKYGVPLESA